MRGEPPKDAEQTRAWNALFNVASLIYDVAYFHGTARECPHGNGRRTCLNAWYCGECFGALRAALNDVAALESAQHPPLLRAWVDSGELTFLRKWLPQGVPCDLSLYPHDDIRLVPIGIDRLDMRPLQ